MQQKAQYASECPKNPDPIVSCTYCHRKGHRAEDCFIRKSNEAVYKQNIRILRTNSAEVNSNNHLAKADSVMFVEQEDNETVAALKRSATGKTQTKQQRIYNNIAEYDKPVIRTDSRTKFEPDLPEPRKTGKTGKKIKKSSQTPTGKALTQALS